MRTNYPTSFLGLATIILLTGCTVKDVDQPALAGPSTLAISITMKASPDTLLQDGSSQSVITITAVDPEGRPKTIPLRADIAVDGVVQDFGRLSTKQPVANGSPLIYTAPPTSSLAAGQVPSTVTILITPTDGVAFDGRGEFSRQVDIKLVPQGIILPTNPNLVANFGVTPASPQAFQNATFDASTTTNGAVACASGCTYSWNFGDGTSSAGISTTHAYRSVGNFPVTLTVTDARGAQTTTTKTITVNNPAPPTGTFTVTPNPAPTNVAIFFNASGVTWAGRTIVRYDWNFGDGNRGTGLTTTHRYSGAGTYNVALTLTDDLGGTSQPIASTVTVSTQGGLTGNLRASTTTPRSGQTVVFDASASTPSAGASIVSYTFIYGDGGQETTNNPIQSHQYTGAAGTTYPATVVVTDSNGKSATSPGVTITIASGS